MKAAIYNPYLDTLGGGERYTMSFAKVLLKEGYQVDVQWSKSQILQPLQERFGINLNGVRIVDDIHKGDGYDLCFWVSDGSVPALRARRNILHFQFPFTNVNGKSLINKMKMFRISSAVCNSNFTKSYIDREYGVNSKVLYPPVEMLASTQSKDNTVLYVGRFSQLTQMKRQDVLVEVFKKLYDSSNVVKKWHLVLAGGSEIGSNSIVKNLREQSKGYPIRIVESPTYRELVNYYSKAKIFWSASGYGVKDKDDPKKYEHFGMTIVEAMSARCVPVVYEGGGHKEIVNKDFGYLWRSKKDLIKFTTQLVSNENKLKKMSIAAKKHAELFSIKVFEERVKEIIQ
ncbi:glycosyltransferase [Candidatus Microgenomates bacterium]|nr:MAG: glycosyltransferase [Candidatus Microgenomates bacterium]